MSGDPELGFDSWFRILSLLTLPGVATVVHSLSRV